jgi:hypothetical protein
VGGYFLVNFAGNFTTKKKKEEMRLSGVSRSQFISGRKK